MLTLFRIHQSKNLIHILFIYLFLEIQFCSNVTLLSLELTIVNQSSLELAAQFTPLTSERRGLYRCTATPGLMFIFYKRQVPFPDLWDKDIETQKERKKQTKPVPTSSSLWQSRDQAMGLPSVSTNPRPLWYSPAPRQLQGLLGAAWPLEKTNSESFREKPRCPVPVRNSAIFSFLECFHQQQ